MERAPVRDRALRLDSGLTLIERRYPAGLRMGRHVHGEWRFCLALHGSYTDSWRRSYRTRTPHHLSLHPADEVHTTVFHSAATCFHVAFTGAWRERLLGAFGIAPEPHEFLTGRVPLVAEQLYHEFHERDAWSPLVLEGLAYELIGFSTRALRTERSGAGWVFRARDLLRDRFREPLTLDDIARAVDVHPVHLARAFRREFRCTVGEFVRRARVDLACAEIDRGSALADVALRAGFADQSHLTRVFRRATGLTPGQYRRRWLGAPRHAPNETEHATATRSPR
jgi:AraC-like DNA-binding protein